jgi:hypothetical protein
MSPAFMIPIDYTFLYRRRSGYFYILSSLAGRLTPEMTRTSTIEKSIQSTFSQHLGIKEKIYIHKQVLVMVYPKPPDLSSLISHP